MRLLSNKKQSTNKRTLLVLPVHNEAPLAPKVSHNLHTFLRKNRLISALVVDDGSTDGTVEAFQRELSDVGEVSLLALPTNGGKARAVRLAFSRAEADFLIFIDGDLAYSFDHIAPLLHSLKKHDVVIGSRSLAPQPQGGSPARRVFLGWGFNHLACLLCGFDYPDTQAGLKGFTAEAAQKLFSRQKIDGFAFDAELLYLAKRLGLSVDQVPAQVSGQHTYKTSQVKLIFDSLRCLKDLFLIRWWSAMGAYKLP